MIHQIFLMSDHSDFPSIFWLFSFFFAQLKEVKKIRRKITQSADTKHSYRLKNSTKFYISQKSHEKKQYDWNFFTKVATKCVIKICTNFGSQVNHFNRFLGCFLQGFWNFRKIWFRYSRKFSQTLIERSGFYQEGESLNSIKRSRIRFTLLSFHPFFCFSVSSLAHFLSLSFSSDHSSLLRLKIFNLFFIDFFL